MKTNLKFGDRVIVSFDGELADREEKEGFYRAESKTGYLHFVGKNKNKTSEVGWWAPLSRIRRAKKKK